MEDVEVPNWLDEKYFEELLSTATVPVTVKKIDVKSAVGKGNNYACDLLRVKIDYFENGTEEKTKSLIVKNPKTGVMNAFVSEMGIIKKEVDIYNILLPRLGKIYGENISTAKIYKSNKEDVLIFDDLNDAGYKMADRLKQLDYDHAVLALKVLARFHGSSVKCHEGDPQLIESLGQDGLVNQKTFRMMSNLLPAYFDVAAVELAKNPETSKYCKKFLEYKEACWDKLFELFAVKSSNFNVLNHGDFWTTNMLFKYDDNGKPIDVKLIDFQMTKYNSPAIDLVYFFTSSVQHEVVKTRNEDLLSQYLKELNSTLERCGSIRRLEIEQLKKSIEEFGFYELFITISVLHMSLLPPEEVPDLKELKEDDLVNPQETMLKHVNNSFFENVLPERLVELEQKGVL